MKISIYINLLLIIGAFLFVFGAMINEGNTNYLNANINSSEWSGQYNYVQQINTTISPLQSTFALIEDQNNGWFTRIGAGIAAIPLAVVRVPLLLFQVFALGGTMLAGMFVTLGLPGQLLIIAVVMVMIWGIFRLIEMYQRWYV